jgi:23S rRNA (pseudouridine1915-N3)-methyltransferase
MKHVDARDYVVLVDERGRDLTSEKLAALVAGASDNGYQGIVFAIGGEDGGGGMEVEGGSGFRGQGVWSFGV